MSVKLKRAYEPSSPDDGRRYLVEALWPRRVSKEALDLTDWLKELAPSTQLRKWYSHVPARWPEFVRRYETELQALEKQPLLGRLVTEARSGAVTLILATRDEEHSGAQVLKEAIDKRLRQ
jgi:uncharacterized protein YeaO (DUF488 family)